jgi:carbon storage regulator CsrA
VLVLSRKCRESVVVGASVDSEPLLTVTVLEITGGRVKLGFEVARDMLVHRWEVWERLQAAGRAARPHRTSEARTGPGPRRHGLACDSHRAFVRESPTDSVRSSRQASPARGGTLNTARKQRGRESRPAPVPP